MKSSDALSTKSKDSSRLEARVVNVQRFSLHDGPGIRSLVFFKGCPLRCLWCANPETISALPEVGFSKTLCSACGKCFPVCPEGAMSPDEGGKPWIDRARCTACGECVSVCPQEAITVYGKSLTVEELFDELRRDEIFYAGSGGGVTVSGGEPLLYADYVIALFKLCRAAGISTAIETCGYVDPAVLKGVLEYTDIVLYDLKVLNDETHTKLTGRSNDLILRNARLVAGSGPVLQFRLPLVPGLNDDIDNIRATAEFIRSVGRDSIELMPYHRLGIGKYEALCRDYSLKDLKSADEEQVEAAKRRFEELGLKCLVSR